MYINEAEDIWRLMKERNSKGKRIAIWAAIKATVVYAWHQMLTVRFAENARSTKRRLMKELLYVLFL